MRNDEGKEENMAGSSSEVDVIEGVQVNVLQGLVEALSVSNNRSNEYQEGNSSQRNGAVGGGTQLQESARCLSAFRRLRE